MHLVIMLGIVETRSQYRHQALDLMKIQHLWSEAVEDHMDPLILLHEFEEYGKTPDQEQPDYRTGRDSKYKLALPT